MLLLQSSSSLLLFQVSSSCTSIFLDGSEVRGGLNVNIQAKYGAISGEISVVVWTPELPLSVDMSDTKLSLIRDWKVPNQGKS